MEPVQRTQTHIPSLLAATFFVLSGLLLLGIGLLMGFSAFFSLITGKPVQAQQTILFIAFSVESALLFAAAFFAFQKNLQKPSADHPSFITLSRRTAALSALFAAGAILIGNQIGAIEPVNWLVLPILTVPAIILPLVILLALGTQGLPLGTRWQSWSAFGLGMSLTPLLLFVLEAIVGILLFIGIVTYMVAQPELASELQAISRQIMILGPQSEAARDLLAPFLTKPAVILIALLYTAVLVPAIEELLKPLGVWLLASRLDSAAQGFTLGALSGAAYGLIETVGVSGQVGEWASLLSSRIGTGLLHITTSALMGAAIVLAWKERRPLRLLRTYSLAVLLHGLWNTFAILYTFSSIAESLNQPGRLSTVQPMVITVMGILAAILLLILLLANRRWRRTILPARSESTRLEEPNEPIP